MRWTTLAALGLFTVVPFFPIACSSTDDAPGNGSPAPVEPTSPAPGPTSPPDPNDAGPKTCPRAANAADRTRKVVVSHPFGEGGAKTKLFEVLELSTTGELARTNETFEMDRALAEIAFTPDGKIGLVAQEDGSVGVFTFDTTGKVRVVHTAFKGGDFYASHVVVSRDGTRAFLVDSNTSENGGGVHEVSIGCDGTLTYVGLAIPGGKAHAMTLLPNDLDRAVLIAGAAFDSAATDYAHRIDLAGTKPTRLASGGVFGDGDAIASWAAVTPDGKWALVTDNGFGKGNRMAPVALDTMRAAATITVPNPAAVAMSPFGNAALLLESDGEDALVILDYDAASATEPFTIRGEVDYKGGKTQLPLIATTIDRGALKGHVLVAENTALRHLVFAADGAVTDLGLLSFDDGLTGIVGSLGMQP
ncbi:MAG: hypothetical protein K0S65_1225 [Labilithrix sp.]|nr:hypothetical protein [Labilithrix sp.]